MHIINVVCSRLWSKRLLTSDNEEDHLNFQYYMKSTTCGERYQLSVLANLLSAKSFNVVIRRMCDNMIKREAPLQQVTVCANKKGD